MACALIGTAQVFKYPLGYADSARLSRGGGGDLMRLSAEIFMTTR